MVRMEIDDQTAFFLSKLIEESVEDSSNFRMLDDSNRMAYDELYHDIIREFGEDLNKNLLTLGGEK